ncbi:MAG: CZB domain-containing protein, partial [Desulfobacteraceae bacterium]
MKWKDLSIGKKMGMGFGAVLALCTVISGYNYLGLTEVKHLAHETGKASAGNQFILMKTIDHLNWTSKLSDLVYNENIHTLEIQTDDHKCGFGKWLYGQEVKQLAAEDHRIGKLVEAIKAPHRRLHRTAIKIKETGKGIAAQGIFQNETLPALQETRAILEQIRDHYNQNFTSTEDQMMKNIAGEIRATLVLALAAVVLGIIAAV